MQNLNLVQLRLVMGSMPNFKSVIILGQTASSARISQARPSASPNRYPGI